MKAVPLIFYAVCLFITTNAQDTLNPLKGDIRVHDPVMIKHSNTYYVFHTGRGVSIKTSKDRINWAKAGSVFSSKDLPTWMNFNSSVGLATNTTLDSTNPNYKWVDEGQIISYKNGGKGVNVIDPNVITDKDGKFWLFYGSYKAGLRLAELNPETGKLLNDPPQIITITKALGEGVFVIRGPEYYYIFASRGICCKGMQSNYQIVMGRSKDIKGTYLNKEGKSWVDNNYSLFLAGDSTEPGRGHNGFFTEGGDTTFIVYHAYTRSANGASLLNIKPLYIDADGWPALDATKQLFRRKEY